MACRYRDLKLIMSHAGYPWVLEACLIAEMRALPLPPEVLEQWLYGNAVRLMGIGQA